MFSGLQTKKDDWEFICLENHWPGSGDEVGKRGLRWLVSIQASTAHGFSRQPACLKSKEWILTVNQYCQTVITKNSEVRGRFSGNTLSGLGVAQHGFPAQLVPNIVPKSRGDWWLLVAANTAL